MGHRPVRRLTGDGQVDRGPPVNWAQFAPLAAEASTEA